MPSDPRPCPICGSTGGREVLHRQRFAEGVLGKGYDVVVCAECGAGFADGIPSQATLDAYYADRSKYAAPGAESSYDIARFKGIADRLAPLLESKDVSILDIGCATGGLLAAFKDRGFKNVTGVDPSPACARIARELHGVNVLVGSMNELGSGERKQADADIQSARSRSPLLREGHYDLICLVGVAEHLRDVRKAIECVTAILKPGGKLFVAVPDVEGLATARNAPFQQFSMEHVNFFSRESLAQLVGTCGLEIEQLWQDAVEWREGIDEPVLSGLFRVAKRGSVSSETLPRFATDVATLPALKRYIEVSREVDAKIAAQVDELARSGQPLLVWGAGALTRRLLAETALSAANIVAFVDSNPFAREKPLSGRAVLAPDQIRGRTESILISSVAFKSELEAKIRGELGMMNRLISLPSITAPSETLPHFATEIEMLLAERPEDAEKRERTTFPRQLAQSDGTVVLFGAGKLGRKCARALAKAGVPVKAFCDSNATLHGTTIDGLGVISVEDAASRFGARSLFCVAIWTGAAGESMWQRIALLGSLGCRIVVPYSALIWAHGTGELPFHSFDLPSRILANGRGGLLSLAASLGDEDSLVVFRDALCQRLLGKFSDLAPAPDQYFVPGISAPTESETVVDGGAYTGDTLAEFLHRTGNRFREYHAFEPDPRNRDALQVMVSKQAPSVRDRIQIHESGLFSKSGNLSFSGNAGVSSSINECGEQSIRVETLDRALPQLQVTFIKLDIEGAELEALRGARERLLAGRPRIAVCVYHKPEDLWTIPAFLREILPGYTFFLRQHGWDGWEIVLYAVPEL